MAQRIIRHHRPPPVAYAFIVNAVNNTVLSTAHKIHRHRNTSRLVHDGLPSLLDDQSTLRSPATVGMLPVAAYRRARNLLSRLRLAAVRGRTGQFEFPRMPRLTDSPTIVRFRIPAALHRAYSVVMNPIFAFAKPACITDCMVALITWYRKSLPPVNRICASGGITAARSFGPISRQGTFRPAAWQVPSDCMELNISTMVSAITTSGRRVATRESRGSRPRVALGI